MKTLIVFRHGKSDWDADYEEDFERPVAKRGRKAAQLMGRFLTVSGQVPDSIVTSPAVRARLTVELAIQSGSWDCRVRLADALYGGSIGEILAEIQSETNDTEVLLIAGHEPAWSQLVGRLIGAAHVRIPTAAMARVDFQEAQNWADVALGRGRLIWLISPKLLKRCDLS